MYELSFLEVQTRTFYFSKEFLAFEKNLNLAKNVGFSFFEKTLKKSQKTVDIIEKIR